MRLGATTQIAMSSVLPLLATIQIVDTVDTVPEEAGRLARGCIKVMGTRGEPGRKLSEFQLSA